MGFTRFDIVEGWYYYCMNFYSGVGDWRYKRLCKIITYFKPGLSSMPCGGGREVYNALCEKYNKE